MSRPASRRGHRRVVIVGEGLGVLNGVVAGVSSHGSSDMNGRDHVASSFFARSSPNPPSHTNSKMSVQLNPSSSLGFRRPLTTLVKRSLTITNNNPQPVAFKVKTTAPKLYCVRPNSGRVEPGESVDVSVMLQALKEEPPLNTKCKDKFLIQSTIITPDKETLALHDIWASPDANEEGKVFQQKLRVTYLPAEGQVLEEEEENQIGMTSTLTANDSVSEEQQRPFTPIPEPVEANVPQETAQPTIPPTDEPVHQSLTPPPPEQHEYARTPSPAPIPVPAPVTVPAPVPAAAQSEPIYITRENPIAALSSEVAQAQQQIQVHQQQAVTQQELRRRTRRLSDADSVAGSDVQTMVEDPPLQQEGVPLQVVVIIALGVFVTTYLFF
ncbi:hypothetical protein NLJ89_g957 [Agrocybe chaxingu]|uniref:MSP domain-containing protein n=1 Tax=Agrocybe chaxingu TaxID=84603 RepID=A0A9W8N0Z0_9AGAR|nr:hypothetical protein NLJ89_g957 [Agrocybe chaxingu]